MCQNVLDEPKEYKWKIKILKSFGNYIFVGVAPIDFDINSSFYDNYGWYFDCHNSSLFSGNPHNYRDKKTDLSKVKDEIIIIFNGIKGTLKFIINNEDKGESYTNIPLNKPLSPVVFLYLSKDSVYITDC